MSKKKPITQIPPPQLPLLNIEKNVKKDRTSAAAAAELYYIPSVKNRQYENSTIKSPRSPRPNPRDTTTAYQIKMNKLMHQPPSPMTPSYITPRQNQIGFFENAHQDEDTPRIMDEFDNWNNIENWNNVDNLRTLFSWITISALNIECLDEAIKRYRKFIAYGTILGLLFSTASGTISATRINTTNTKDNVNLVLAALFTILSFAIAIYTGILKILQIQERLENFIKIKQEWILFSASISSELQLPIHLRKPVLGIISIYKNKFLDLLKVDSEVPEFIKNDIIEKIKKKEEEKYKNEKWEDLKYSEASSLSDVIIEIGSRELKRLVLELDNSIQNAIFNREIKQGSSLVRGGGATTTDGGWHSDDDENPNVIYTYRTMESMDTIPGIKSSKSEEDDIKKLKRDIENIYKQFSIINGTQTSPSAPLTRKSSDNNLHTLTNNNSSKKKSASIVSAATAIEDDSVAGLCKKMLDRKFSSASIVPPTPPSQNELIIAPRTDNEAYQLNTSDHASSYSSNVAQHNTDIILNELEKGSPSTSETVTPQVQSSNDLVSLRRETIPISDKHRTI